MSTVQWSGALSLDLPAVDDSLPEDEIRGCASAACSSSDG
jgi:hypothetical protein